MDNQIELLQTLLIKCMDEIQVQKVLVTQINDKLDAFIESSGLSIKRQDKTNDRRVTVHQTILSGIIAIVCVIIPLVAKAMFGH